MLTDAPTVWRQHNCTSRHRTVKTWLRCAVPRLEWVHGSGEIALIAWCRHITITLHDSVESAEASKRFIDASGCGGRCVRNHQIVRVDRGDS